MKTGNPPGRLRAFGPSLRGCRSLYGRYQNRKSAGQAQGLRPFASRLSPHIRKPSKPKENEFPFGSEGLRMPGS